MSAACCVMEWKNAHSFLFGHLRGRPQSRLKKQSISSSSAAKDLLANGGGHASHISRAALPLSSEPVWAAASRQRFANAGLSGAVVEAAAAAHTSAKPPDQ